jgi:hypothetical protein
MPHITLAAALEGDDLPAVELPAMAAADFDVDAHPSAAAWAHEVAYDEYADPESVVLVVLPGTNTKGYETIMVEVNDDEYARFLAAVVRHRAAAA